MAKGAGAAYDRLRVPKDGLSQSIQFWGRQQGQSIDNITKRNERDQVREEQKREKLRERLGFDESELVPTMVGQEHFDDVSRTFGKNAIAAATNYELEAARLLNEEGDIQGFNRELAKSKQVQYEMRQWNANAEKVGEKVDAYVKRIDKLNPNDESSLVMDAIIKNNYIPIPDENGKLRLLVGIDVDGDGEISDEERKAGEDSLKKGKKGKNPQFKEISPYDIINGDFDPYEKVELKGEDGLINQLASTVGMLEKQEETGLYSRTTEGFDESKKKQLIANVQAELENPETLSWVLTQATAGQEGGASKKASHDIEDYTKEEKETAKNFLTNAVINSYAEKDKKKFLVGKANYQNKISEDDTEEVASAELVTNIQEEPSRGANDEQRPLSDPMSKQPLEFRFKTKSGKPKPITGVLEDNPSAQILSVIKRGDKYYAKTRVSSDVSVKSQDFNLGADVVTTRKEGGETSQVALTDTELNIIADNLKLKNAAELDRYLTGQLGKGKNKTSSLTEGIKTR